MLPSNINNTPFPPMSQIPFASSPFSPIHFKATILKRERRRKLLRTILTLAAIAYYHRDRLEKVIIHKILPQLLRLMGNVLNKSSNLFDHLLAASNPMIKPKRTYDLNKIFPPPPTTSSRNPPKNLTIPLTPPSLTFSGCCWNLFYHLGVAKCLKSKYPPTSTFKSAGVSCGAIIAYAITDDVSLTSVTDFMYTMLRSSSYTSNPLSPAGRMTEIVRSGLEKFVRKGAAERCRGRLMVGVSEFNSLRGDR